VAVTGCSHISLEDANLTGIMLIDVEKKAASHSTSGRTTSKVWP
jgi:hypothetical protein